MTNLQRRYDDLNSDSTEGELRALRDEVVALREAVLRQGNERLAEWGAASEGARNLAHYLALRSRDLSALQGRLAAFGLSSLGRSEDHVMTSLDGLVTTLNRLNGVASDYPPANMRRAGENALAQACDRIFGAREKSQSTRIMVTLPSEAADDPDLVRTLIEAGMDCARINCAHDDAAAWERMAKHVRVEAKRRGAPCPILMDVAGPKLRVETVQAPEGYRLRPGERPHLVAAPDRREKFPAFTINFPQVLSQLREGADISFDDGKAIGRVVSVTESRAELEITAARAKGLRLKPGKGVNLPTTELELPSLTNKDLADLDIVARVADLVGLSFVQRGEDVRRFQSELAARRGDRPAQALVLKIETPLAIRNLPKLIVAATEKNPTAVMIARGDLAIEVGFARLSEMQEEILWLCEAAHIPVIWATQVLDQLIHEGVVSRAETTDAAAAQHADCVMLNKGPYLAQGVRFLRDVLDRMERHHLKKFDRLGHLKAWS